MFADDGVRDGVQAEQPDRVVQPAGLQVKVAKLVELSFTEEHDAVTALRHVVEHLHRLADTVRT